MTSLPLLSVVVPCFNEEEVLPETARRLESLLDQLASEQRIAADSHVVFVDDGSTDATWRLIKSFHERSSRIRGLKLSRNFGHQRALLAGLMNAQGDIVVSIDADLQDDIGTIGDMIAAHAGVPTWFSASVVAGSAIPASSAAPPRPITGCCNGWALRSFQTTRITGS